MGRGKTSSEVSGSAIARIDERVTYLVEDVKEIKSDLKGLKGSYITKKEFELRLEAVSQRLKLSERIIFGLVILIVIAVVNSLIRLVVN